MAGNPVAAIFKAHLRIRDYDRYERGQARTPPRFAPGYWMAERDILLAGGVRRRRLARRQARRALLGRVGDAAGF